MKKFLLASALIFASGASLAHFGSVLPDKSSVDDPKDSTVTLTAAFNHPMEQTGMTMAKPKSFSVIVNGKKTDLTDKLEKTQVLNKDAWITQYKVMRPGLYQFVAEPEPYWEASEDKFIVHYSKIMLPVYGEDGDWHKPVGLPTEIVPLTRPFGNYAGNVFQGKVLVDGKASPNTDVEVEFYNVDNKVKAPSPIHVTQVVRTDDNGVFTFVVPWAGWWGFAALNEANYKIQKDGTDKPVEIGAVLWTEFVAPRF